MTDLPARVAVVDLPTPYRNRHLIREDGGRTRFGIGAEGHYGMGTMTVEAMKALGSLVLPLLAPDAYVFAWTTRPNLPMYLDILQSWGLRYVTEPFVWIKTYPDGRPFKGTGRYVPANPEDVLLFRRPGSRCWHPKEGRKPVAEIRTVHPRFLGLPHSRKPEVFQDALERWLGPHMDGHGFLELFATRAREGWTCLGHSVTGRDIRDDLLDRILDLSA